MQAKKSGRSRKITVPGAHTTWLEMQASHDYRWELFRLDLFVIGKPDRILRLPSVRAGLRMTMRRCQAEVLLQVLAEVEGKGSRIRRKGLVRREAYYIQ